MADRSDDDAHIPAPRTDEGSVEDESDAGLPAQRPRRPLADAGASVVYSHYDPSRTKKMYALKSQELQE